MLVLITVIALAGIIAYLAKRGIVTKKQAWLSLGSLSAVIMVYAVVHALLAVLYLVPAVLVAIGVYKLLKKRDQPDVQD